jgi:hypothetical protein
MQLLDDSGEGPRGLVKEVEASLEGFGLVGVVSLVDGLVPELPAKI